MFLSVTCGHTQSGLGLKAPSKRPSYHRPDHACCSQKRPHPQASLLPRRALRTTLPTSQGGVVHLFVVYGYQGAEGDAHQLQLTDRLLQAVLAEAPAVCVG